VGVWRRKSCWELYLDNVVEKTKKVTVKQHHSMDIYNISKDIEEHTQQTEQRTMETNGP